MQSSSPSPSSQANLTGDGAIAQGDGAQALGQGAALLAPGAQVNAPMVTGDHNIIIGASSSQTQAPDPLVLAQWLEKLLAHPTLWQTQAPIVQQTLTQTAHNLRTPTKFDPAAPKDPLAHIQNELRGLMATGLLNWKLPTHWQNDIEPRYVLQNLTAAMLYPLLAAKSLPNYWKPALAVLASPEIAELMFLAVTTPSKNLSEKLAGLGQKLSDPRYQDGIRCLLTDMRDPARGWAYINALGTMSEGHPLTPPKDNAEWLRIILIGASSAVAAAGLSLWLSDAMRALGHINVDHESSPSPKPPPTAVPPASRPAAKGLPLGDLAFCLVPRGPFWMGSPDSDGEAYESEKPIHLVDLDSYAISRSPITVAQFAEFVRQTGYQSSAERVGSLWVYHKNTKNWGEMAGACWRHPFGKGSDVLGRELHPVNHISWDDASAFCGWLGQHYGLTCRLPSEAEWEKAARGGLELPRQPLVLRLAEWAEWGNVRVSWQPNPLPQRRYPWGSQAIDRTRANYDLTVGDTTPVGSYLTGNSPYDCVDMIGNVWEWCRDWWADDIYKNRRGTTRNPQGPASGESHSLRGGAFDLNGWDARCACRFRDVSDSRNFIDGFRVMLSPLSLAL